MSPFVIDWEARAWMPERTRRILMRAKELAKQFEFGGPMPMKFDAVASGAGTSVEITIAMEVLHRDSLIKSWLHFRHPIKETIMQAADEELTEVLKAEIVRAACALWQHEFDEWMKFDGIRVNDPHKDDPVVFHANGDLENV